MKAVILAAGKGERLGPLTGRVTKAMVPVANVPITELLIRQIARETGIEEFTVVANGPEQDVVKHLDALENLDDDNGPLRFRFAYQPERVGMGHALKCALKAWPMDGPFLLAACDSLYPPGDVGRFVDSFEEQKYDAYLALLGMPPELMASSSTVKIEDNLITGIIEKPGPQQLLSPYASLPLYVLCPGIGQYLDRIRPSKRGTLEFQDALRMLIDDGGAIGWHEMPGRDTVTSIAHLIELNTRRLRAMPDPVPSDEYDALVIEPVLLGKGLEIGDGTVIGPNAVVGDDTRIGGNCRVKNAVIFAGSTIPEGSTVENACWLDDTMYSA